MKKIILFYFIFLFILFSAFNFVQAESGYTVSPAIINDQGAIRDILEYKIKFKNNLTRKIDVFAIRKDVSEEKGEIDFVEETEADKSISLNSWIEFTGGAVELEPGEEKEVPLTIKISPYATPGEHHARFIFSESAHRVDAEKIAETLNLPELNISINVKENIVELSELVSFGTKKSIFFKGPVVFMSKLRNIGNINVVPKGSISIYNRKGQEVDVVDINPDNQEMVAETEKEFISNWTKSSFGKFKARLNVDYGVNKKSLQDSVYFWMIPVRVIIIFCIGIFLLLLILAIIIFKKTRQEEEIEDYQNYHHSVKTVAKIKPIDPGGHVLDLKRK